MNHCHRASNWIPDKSFQHSEFWHSCWPISDPTIYVVANTYNGVLEQPKLKQQCSIKIKHFIRIQPCHARTHTHTHTPTHTHTHTHTHTQFIHNIKTGVHLLQMLIKWIIHTCRLKHTLIKALSHNYTVVTLLYNCFMNVNLFLRGKVRRSWLLRYGDKWDWFQMLVKAWSSFTRKTWIKS